jgi:hypothetical protein
LAKETLARLWRGVELGRRADDLLSICESFGFAPTRGAALSAKIDKRPVAGVNDAQRTAPFAERRPQAGLSVADMLGEGSPGVFVDR